MVTDWIHLPPEAEPFSLWPALHDAELHSVRSSRLERWAVLEFQIPHLRIRSAAEEGLAVQFRLTGVSALRLLTFAVWPGPVPATAGRTPEEQERLAREYQEKGREESLAWTTLEETVNDAGFLTLQAYLASGPGELSLRVEGLLDDDQWCVLSLRATALLISSADGSNLTVDNLIDLGNAYWGTLGTRPG